MATNKNNPTPGREKTYQQHKYRLYSSAVDVPVSNTSLDSLAQTPAINEFYKQVSKTYSRRVPGNEYDLSQPVWFYMIMKKLAEEKEKKT